MSRIRLVLLVVVVGLSGCAGVPSSGPVYQAHAVLPAGTLEELDVRVLPHGPAAGESPEQVVTGFLVASENFDNAHAIAREFLTPAEAARWRDNAGVVEYQTGSSALVRRSSTAVELAVTREAVISSGGDFRLAPGPFATTFGLARTTQGWRIDRAPDGLLLSSLDVARSYRRLQLYFPSPDGQVLVSDPVFMAADRLALPTLLVQRLLAGPSPWLAPAVSTVVPVGTTLLGNVPVTAGVAGVDLSRDLAALNPSALDRLSAQLSWTLRQLPDVAAVELSSNGLPVAVPGLGERVAVSSWSQFDPDVVTGPPFVYLGRAGLRTPTGPVTGPLGRGAPWFSSPAVSLDGLRVAGLRAGSAGSTLYVGALTGRPVAVLSAAAFTPPSFDRFGRVWTVQTDGQGRQRVVVVDREGRPTVVPAAELLAAGPVQALRVARDGARLAAIVGRGRAARLVLARIDARTIVDALRVLAPSYAGVVGLGWLDSDTVVALARAGGSGPFGPVEVAIDGSVLTPIPVGGLPAANPSTIAAAPDADLLVGSAGGIWAATAGGWRRVGSGLDPVYPG